MTCHRHDAASQSACPHVMNIPPLYKPSKYDIKIAKKYPKTIMRVCDIFNNKIYSYDGNGIKKTFKFKR